MKELRAAVEAFWAAGIEEIYIDGSSCTDKPDPGDIDGYWVEPDPGVYDRIDRPPLSRPFFARNKLMSTGSGV